MNERKKTIPKTAQEMAIEARNRAMESGVAARNKQLAQGTKVNYRPLGTSPHQLADRIHTAQSPSDTELTARIAVLEALLVNVSSPIQIQSINYCDGGPSDFLIL